MTEKCMREGCNRVTISELDRPYCSPICNIQELDKGKARYRKKLSELKADHKELAEAAENMLEFLVRAAPIDGLYSSNIDEWDCLIKEAKGE